MIFFYLCGLCGARKKSPAGTVFTTLHVGVTLVILSFSYFLINGIIKKIPVIFERIYPNG